MEQKLSYRKETNIIEEQSMKKKHYHRNNGTNTRNREISKLKD